MDFIIKNGLTRLAGPSNKQVIYFYFFYCCYRMSVKRREEVSATHRLSFALSFRDLVVTARISKETIIFARII